VPEWEPHWDGWLGWGSIGAGFSLDRSLDRKRMSLGAGETVSKVYVDAIGVDSVSVLAVRPMILGFERLGLDRGVALDAAGLTDDQLGNPDSRVSPRQILLLWMKALEATGDPSLGLNLAKTVNPSDYGIVGYILFSSATVRDALQRLNRYHGLLADSVRYAVEETRSGFILRHEILGGGAVPGAMAAYVLAVPILLLEKTLGRRPRIRQVRLACERPFETDEYEDVFDAPLSFGESENMLEIAADLDSAIPTADFALMSALETHAESLLEESNVNLSLAESVRKLILDAFPEPPPEVEKLGRKLALSPRTLRRRLREEGTSVSSIVARARHQLALKYLVRDELGASEIAYMLGFSDPTAFHRAFRRWQGCSPLEHRRQQARTTL
jgi:AraC-like DNA-binding protein